MGFWSPSEDEQTWADAHAQVNNAPHEAELSHELIAAAASYEAAKAYEKHREKNGENLSHEKLKEILAGFSGAYIDRIVETKGLDDVARENAKRAAQAKVDAHFAQFDGQY